MNVENTTRANLAFQRVQGMYALPLGERDQVIGSHAPTVLATTDASAGIACVPLPETTTGGTMPTFEDPVADGAEAREHFGALANATFVCESGATV